MSAEVIIHRAGPGLTVQDFGRPGYLAFGLSRGGAADRLALAEGAALLGQGEACAAIEMAGTGGEFEVTGDVIIALSGAPMKASVDGERLPWNTTHVLGQGARLSIGGTEAGNYGYLHFAGGVGGRRLLNAEGAHLTAGLGRTLQAGDQIGLGDCIAKGEAGMTLDVRPRFSGGTVRVVPSLQTHIFGESETARFEASEFKRDARGNRMGARFLPSGDGFQAASGLSILSEVIVPGDIQVTGDGTPFVLLSECQTTGGYPRIGAVLPADLPIVAQAQPGATLRFKFVELAEAVEIERRERDYRTKLHKAVRPLIRDPAQMHDLLSYQLISGMTAGDDMEREA